MAKKIENKYLWYLTRRIIFLLLSLSVISISIYYLFAEYRQFFVSTDPLIFWLGYLFIALIIINTGGLLLSTALIIKAVFYIKMGYKYDSNEDNLSLKVGKIDD